MSNKLVEVLKVLEQYGLVDDTGHIHNCGYPQCKCAELGTDLQLAMSDHEHIRRDIQANTNRILGQLRHDYEIPMPKEFQ